MKVSGFIKFENLGGLLIVKEGDTGFDELKKINDSGEWTEYVNSMLMNKISVRYDYITNSFVVNPYEIKLKESLNYGFDDEFEEPVRVIGVEDIEGLFANVIKSTVASEIKKGLESLKNDIFGTVTSHESNEVKVNEVSLDKIRDKGNEIELHPDLKRILGSKILQPRQEESAFEEEVFFQNTYPKFEAPKTAVNLNRTEEISGIQVKLVLTGLLITEPEIKHIVTECKNNGLIVQKIVGKKDAIAVKAKNKLNESVLIYLDSEKIEVNKTKFRRLNEALKFANRNLKQEEAVMFEKVFDKTKKQKTNIIESAKIPLQQLSRKITTLGSLNLKNGYNEKTNNILEQKNSYNTLLKSDTGKYLLVKGVVFKDKNLYESVFLHETKQGKNCFVGNYKVIGKYENSAEGLGEIMFECKKTSVNLAFLN